VSVVNHLPDPDIRRQALWALHLPRTCHESRFECVCFALYCGVDVVQNQLNRTRVVHVKWPEAHHAVLIDLCLMRLGAKGLTRLAISRVRSA